MAGIPSLLLSTLEDMLAEDLRRFKFWLSNDLPEGFEPIGQGRLEGKERDEIVQLMVRTYGEEGAVKVTLHVLRKANQNGLAQRLEEDLGGNAIAQAVPPCPEGQGQKLEKDLGGNAIAQAVPPCPEGQGQNGASSRTTSGPGPLVSIQCDGGKVQAPTINQSTFSADVHFNFK